MKHQWWVIVGIGCLGIGVSISPAQESEAPSSESETQRLSPVAREFIEAAKARLEAEQTRQAEEAQARQREEAQRLAIEQAREKATILAEQERRARQQLQAARERQLQQLYTKGRSLYRQGAYAEAIDVFQQMLLMDPSHRLTGSAKQLMMQAEAKLFEARARTHASGIPEMRGAVVSDLERLLEEKRMELDTVLKYAKSAVHEGRHEFAIELLERILDQDPGHREAGQWLQHAQLALLKEQEERFAKQLELDEQRMMNEVLEAQLTSASMGSGAGLGHPLALPTHDTLDPKTLQKLQQPISFDFQDVALIDVLDFLADAATISVIPSPKLDLSAQRVSLRVKEVPLGLALKYLVSSLDLTYRLENMAILIAAPGEFANEPLETRVFFLSSGLGPFALETAAIEPNRPLEMSSLKPLLEGAIPSPSGSKLVIDERSGALIVTNTAKNMNLVERLLGQLDIAPVQVLIETRFVEVTLTELEQLGLESVLTGDAALTKKYDNKDTEGPGDQITSGSGFKFPALAREDEGLNLTLQGVLTGTQFETVLHWLEERQDSRTLSAPKVTTLNNQMASIKVVDEFRYPTRYEVSLIQFDVNGDGDFDDAGETEFVNVPQDIQKRDIGLLLNVTPSVGKERRTVTLVLAPEVSQFSQFRDLGGGVTVPEFTTSQLTTSVVIENGQTVVLGGLMKDTISNQVTKVPFLGDLPLVGALFRQRDESQTRKNLLIFVTARVLAPQGPAI